MSMILQYVSAFAVGGALCVVAQILIDYTSLTPCKILVIYVVSGVVLSGVGLYGPLEKIAQCGATVPLTGFGHTLCEGVKKAVSENGLIGVLTGGLSATAGGISAALVFGYIAALIFKGKPK